MATRFFGGTAARLKLHDAQDRVGELNRAAAELGREVADAAGRTVIVAGESDLSLTGNASVIGRPTTVPISAGIGEGDLSYTSFEYDDLELDAARIDTTGQASCTRDCRPAPRRFAAGGRPGPSAPTSSA